MWGAFNTGSGGGGDASDVSYNNSNSGVSADNVQDALDIALGVPLPSLTVNVLAGSNVSVTDGSTTINGTSDSGNTFTTLLPAVGTWTATASLGERTASGSVEVVPAAYSLDLEYFSANLTVTAESGSTVTATDGSHTYTAVANSSNKAYITIGVSGTYSITATKNGVNSNTVSVNANASGASLTATVSFIKLTLTSPSGSSISLKNGSTTLTGTSTGSNVFYLPNTGTWSVTITKNSDTASGSVSASNYQSYSLTLNYFSATLTVTAVSGASVTAVSGSNTFSATAGTNGKATITVKASGTYTVSATYSGASSNSKSVSVSTSGGSYTATVNFIRLTLTSPSGSAITVSKSGSSSLTKTSTGSDLFYLTSTGTWTVTITKNGDTASGSVSASSYQDYTLSLSYVGIYGVTWDGTSTTAWTRTDDAAGFTDPVPYVAGATSYSSPFDNIMPWSGMVKSERTGGTMVAIPKFWYKLTQNGNGLKIQIANGAQTGFSVSPAHIDRGDGKGERDVVYIGRYHCHTSDYKSKTGGKPKGGITRPAARTAIHNLGSTIWQTDFLMRFTIWLLYLVEFANWDSQSKIGYGCGKGIGTGAEDMGASDTMPYHTGTMKTDRTTYGVGVQYRNIEGLWDNVLDWLDGFYYNGQGMQLIKNPANFSDTANGTLIGKPSDGTPSKFTVVTVDGAVLFYATESKGSTTTYTCDGWKFSTSLTYPYSGGYYNYNLGAGLFMINCFNNGADSGIGCRIMELP